VLKLINKLPCRKTRLLGRGVFEEREPELVEIELEKWTNVDSDSGILADNLNLDYYLGGQPGAGLSYLL